MEQTPANHSYKQKRFLLGQLASFGDCLYATAIARQIKTDFPGCHLTWAIGSIYRSILINNPFVDEIWEIPLKNRDDAVSAWIKFEKAARERLCRKEFDEIFFTQVNPNNYQNFDGTLRYSIFRGYPHPITVPVTPIIRLTDVEIRNVHDFIQRHDLDGKKKVILFECVPYSGQSFVTPDFALDTARRLISEIPDVYFILSGNIPCASDEERIIDGSVLSFRENAELTKYCSLLVGCSSGISWLCTSDWAKPLPMIQLLKKRTSFYASFVHDYEYRQEDVSLFLEMTDCSAEKLCECIKLIYTNGFPVARSRYHENIPLSFDYYCRALGYLVARGDFNGAVNSLRITANRYGWRPQLIKALLKSLLLGPFVVPVKIAQNFTKSLTKDK